MESIEKLRQEMPLVFERRDDLVSQVAEATADYHLKIDQLRVSLAPDEFVAERERLYRLHAASIEPVRKEIGCIDRKLADILAAMSPRPIIVTR